MECNDSPESSKPEQALIDWSNAFHVMSLAAMMTHVRTTVLKLERTIQTKHVTPRPFELAAALPHIKGVFEDCTSTSSLEDTTHTSVISQ